MGLTIVRSDIYVYAIWFGILLVSRVPTSTNAQGQHSSCVLDPSPNLTLFLDALIVPPTISISNGVQLTLGVYKITKKMHSELPATTVYAYGQDEASATYPGPSLEAIRDTPAHVRFENHITDTQHFLTVDTSLNWAAPPNGGVPIVTHLHGGEAQSQFDGHPDAWFTRSGDRGSTYVTQDYTYPNSQPPSLLWYHDHTVGITTQNILAGLIGLYFIRSPSEEPSNLPSGIYEIPLVIQDKQFWANGSINFPDTGVSPDNHPNWCPHYSGDTIVVNGIAWPYANVYPAKYRFRFLNAAVARYFTLTLSNASVTMTQIGTDGGYLPAPMSITNLTLAPAYRADVIIDFSNMSPGTSVYMNNSASDPFPSTNLPIDAPPINSVMKFNVIKNPHTVPSQIIPTSFGSEAAYPKGYSGNVDFGNTTSVHRMLAVAEPNDPSGAPITVLINNLTWTAGVTETPKLGSVEIWDIVNLTPRAHPVHLHLINFLTVFYQQFNQTSYDAGTCSLLVQYPDSTSCFTQARQLPEALQLGWKDVVSVNASSVTRFWTRWTARSGGKFPFDATTSPGYLWHCHVLGHEDNDMMRPLRLTS